MRVPGSRPATDSARVSASSADSAPAPSPLGRHLLSALPGAAFGAALCVQISALSWILSIRYGLSLSEIGWIWAAGPVAGILGQLGAGLGSDRTWFLGGRRRIYILVGGFFCATFLLLLPHLDSAREFFGLASVVPIALVVVLGLDLAVNIGLGPARSLIIDHSVAGADRVRAFSWAQAVSGSVGVLCYALAAFFGNAVLITVGAFLVLALAWIPSFLIREERALRDDDATTTDVPDSAFRTAGSNRGPRARAIRICIANGVTWLGFQLLFVFGATAVTDPSGRTLALLFGVLNAVGMLAPVTLVPLVTRRISDPSRAHALLLLGSAFALGAMTIVVGHPLLVALGMAIVGIGWGSCLSLPLAIFSDASAGSGGATTTGARMGWFNLSVVIPQLAISAIGAPLLGAFTGHAGAVFGLTGVFFAISAAFWLRPEA